MDKFSSTFILLISVTLALGQRPSFAGFRPIGFPEIEKNTNNGLGDRFGEVDGTTPKLPLEAQGDVGLIDRLSKLPVDKQPFWFINWQAYEANRQNPQTYPQRPNSFIDPIPTNNANSNSASTSNSDLTFNSASTSTPASTSNSASTSTPASTSISASTSNSDSTVNRFGEVDAKKPVLLPTSSDSVESKPDSEEKPEVTKPVTMNKKEDSSKVKPAVSNSNSTISNSEPGSKLDEAAPLIPSPIEPESTLVDGLKLKEDSTAEKKVSIFRF